MLKELKAVDVGFWRLRSTQQRPISTDPGVSHVDITPFLSLSLASALPVISLSFFFFMLKINSENT